MKNGLIYLLILISMPGIGQEIPAWIENASRNEAFPQDEYYTSFISSGYRKKEEVDLLTKQTLSDARNELSETLFQTINTLVNAGYGQPTNLDKTNFSKEVLEQAGMKTEKYIDERSKVIYALAYLPKRSLKTTYFNKLSNSISEIKTQLENIEGIENKGEAYDEYMSVIDRLDKVNVTRQLLYRLGITNEVALMTAEWTHFQNYTNDQLEKLRNTKEITIDEAAFFVIEKVLSQLEQNLPIGLQPITYKNTGIATEFSLRFNQLLTFNLVKKEVAVKSGADASNFVLTGTYWPRVDKIQISVNISERYDDETQRVLASGSVYMPLEQVENEQMDYEPELPATIEKNNLLSLQKKLNGGMKGELTTQKGKESLVFNEGDVLELYIMVNRPAYIRLLNVWPDNQQLLLLDNYYVDEEHINQEIKMPFNWQTACPCGTEYIQMFAQSEPFEYIEIETEDGFDFINEPLEETLKKCRKYDLEGTPEGAYRTEANIVLTTMP